MKNKLSALEIICIICIDLAAINILFFGAILSAILFGLLGGILLIWRNNGIQK